MPPRRTSGPADGGPVTGPPTRTADAAPAERPEGGDDQAAGGRAGQTAPQWLRKVAGWSWRSIVVAAAVTLVFWALDKVLLAVVAVFLALVITAVLRPLTDLLRKVLPSALATVLSLVLALLAAGGALTYIGYSVITEWSSVEWQLNRGIETVGRLVQQSPVAGSVPGEDLQAWMDSAQEWIRDHRQLVVDRVLAGAGLLALAFTTLALAVFLSVFFLNRGAEMWRWFLGQLPSRSRRAWATGGEVAWSTFSGYTAGMFIIAAADAVLAFAALSLLDVPLAAPLAMLVFIGALIPLVGAPAAMLIAVVVALAANGVLNAVLVGVAIALIGQIDGHVLEPLVMGRGVSVHPTVVALAVTAGALIAGILGAVVAVPIVSVSWAVFSRLRSQNEPTGPEGQTGDQGEAASVAVAGPDEAGSR